MARRRKNRRGRNGGGGEDSMPDESAAAAVAEVRTKRKPRKPSRSREIRLEEAREAAGLAACNDETTTTDKHSTLLPRPFPEHLPRPSGMLHNTDDTYQESFTAALETAYEGFVVDTDLSQAASNALDHEDSSRTTTAVPGQDEMKRALQSDLSPYYRTDVTQPFGLGTKCALTRVTRCLLGDPGTTYKYLGLRMFAIPWNNQDEEKGNNNGPHQVTKQLNQASGATTAVRQLRDVLEQRTLIHLEELDRKRKARGVENSEFGSNEFNICLINRMDPADPMIMPMSDKSLATSNVEQQQCSVSWHADSSLRHYSTIAVYQTLAQELCHNDGADAPTTDNQQTWSVALRVAPHSEGPTASSFGVLQRKQSNGSKEDSVGKADGDNAESAPVLAVSLPSGSTYYLLNDFNHHHQHAVMVSTDSSGRNNDEHLVVDNGRSIRYSCTFRLLREGHTVQFMLERCQRAVSNFHKKGLKVWRSEQLLLTELESDWLRQFYVQGRQHHDLLWPFWGEPMKQLLGYWSQLEARTYQIIQFFLRAAEGRCRFGPPMTSDNQKDNPKPAVPPPVDKNSRGSGKLKQQKKAYEAMKDLLDRHVHLDRTRSASVASVQLLCDGFADFLDERADMRELWVQREKDPVFQKLDLDDRPIHVPVEFSVLFSRGISHDRVMSRDVGLSPLPSSPDELRNLGNDVRTSGRVYQSGNFTDLSALVTPNDSSNVTDSAAGRVDEPEHSKSHEWQGWKDREYGLEMQSPWARALLEGRKTVETRLYDLPPALLGRRLWIIESPKSVKAGVSSLGDVMEFGSSESKIIGWCLFSSVKLYTDGQSFHADERNHLVTESSGYGWKPGETEVVYGWMVGDYCLTDDRASMASSSYVSAVRRMRSLFELQTGKSRERQKTRDRRKKVREREKARKREKKDTNGADNEQGKKKRRKRF